MSILCFYLYSPFSWKFVKFAYVICRLSLTFDGVAVPQLESAFQSIQSTAAGFAARRNVVSLLKIQIQCRSSNRFAFGFCLFGRILKHYVVSSFCSPPAKIPSIVDRLVHVLYKHMKIKKKSLQNETQNKNLNSLVGLLLIVFAGKRCQLFFFCSFCFVLFGKDLLKSFFKSELLGS